MIGSLCQSSGCPDHSRSRALDTEIPRATRQHDLCRIAVDYLMRYCDKNLSKFSQISEYVNRVLSENPDRLSCMLSLGDRKLIPFPQNLSSTGEVMSLRYDFKAGNVVVEIESLPARKETFAQVEERQGKKILVINEYSICLRTINEFEELCLHDGSNPLFSGYVAVKIDDQFFYVSCQEIAEAIQKASVGEKKIKNLLEVAVQNLLGIFKHQVPSIDFSENNPELEDALQNGGLTSGQAKELIQYVHKNYSVLIDALSWTPSPFHCIRIKKEVPCSVTFLADDCFQIEFTMTYLRKSPLSVVRKVVLYASDEHNGPCVTTMECRRVRTKTNAGVLLGQEKQRYQQKVLLAGYALGKKIKNVVPYVNHEFLLTIPAQGGKVKEKIYSEEGLGTVDEVFLSSARGISFENQYCSLYASMLCAITSMAFLHQNCYVHFDINSKNILVMRDGSSRLIGFGSARFFHEGDAALSSSIPQSTPGYREPQSYKEEFLINKNAGIAIDTFALGATLIKLFCPQILPGRRFLQCQISGIHNKNEKELFDETCIDVLDYQKVLCRRAQSSPPDKAALYKAIAEMINISRKDRPSLQEVFHILLENAPSQAIQLFGEFERRYTQIS